MSEIRTCELYQPLETTPLVLYGASSIISRCNAIPGLLLKSPKHKWPEGETSDAALDIKHKFDVEACILEQLTPHPRIIRYLCQSKTARFTGLLLLEEKHGDLQEYLDKSFPTIQLPLKMQWCLQIAQALEHCHSQNVVHCDLRPANCLLDVDLNIRLCDFGGSKFNDLYGYGLPDFGFFDPRCVDDEASPALDIFALGSVMYTIMTGHFPFGGEGLTKKTGEEIAAYEIAVEEKFAKGVFPDTSEMVNGDVTQRCWASKGPSAGEIVQALKALEGTY